MSEKNVVEEFAEELAGLRQNEDGTYDAGSGVSLRFKPVSAGLIAELQTRIKDPAVPITELEDGREVPNPNDRAYQAEIRENDDKRNQVVFDAFLMFGVEIVGGLPEDDKWIRELEFLGIEVDTSSDISKEFAYKKHILGSSALIFKVAELSGVSSAQIQAAKDTFQGNTQRPTN